MGDEYLTYISLSGIAHSIFTYRGWSIVLVVEVIF